MLQTVYSVKEVQKITKLGRNTVSKLIETKQIKSVRAGRRILIPAWALEEFLKQAQ